MYILQDSKIHSLLWKTLIYKFQPKLIEGRVYAITKFGVGSNGGDFRTTRYEYHLNFQYNTDVQIMQHLIINGNPYTFYSFFQYNWQQFQHNLFLSTGTCFLPPYLFYFFLSKGSFDFISPNFDLGSRFAPNDNIHS